MRDILANAIDPSGLYTASAVSTFTVTAGNASAPTGTVTSAYDGDGNVVSRSWTNGTVQTLAYDAFNRLIQVSQRDSSQNGYDWTAVYDGLGRRLQTTLQPIANNNASGAATVTSSIYDPQVEFLEIGVNVNGVQAWKVYGPDLNGTYGGLQGTGGLEAVVMDSGGTATGVLNDYFGNDVATISGGSVTWNTTHVGQYVPLTSGNTDPTYANYANAGHVEGKAALWIRANDSTGGVVYHNNTDGTCPFCNSFTPTLLPEDATLTVVPPEGAAPKNPSWQASNTTYVGNSAVPKPNPKLVQ